MSIILKSNSCSYWRYKIIHTKNIKFSRYGEAFEAIVTWDDQPWKNLGPKATKAFWKVKLIHPQEMDIEKQRIRANGFFSRMRLSHCDYGFTLKEDGSEENGNIYPSVVEEILYRYYNTDCHDFYCNRVENMKLAIDNKYAKKLEEIAKKKQELHKKLRSGELDAKAYQISLRPIRKEKEKLKLNRLNAKDGIYNRYFECDKVKKTLRYGFSKTNQCPSPSDKIEKIILHIPHSSTYVPETFKVLDGVSLEGEFQRMTDWFTDELFDFDEAEKLIFPCSRLYCDVERFRVDRDESMAKKGMGVCYTRTSHGGELRKVGSKEKAFIKSTIYDEHHKKLDGLVERELWKDNCALIIDCHSFPNEIYAQHNPGDARPDICIGTDGFHTPDALLSSVCDYFEKEGFTVAINEPFSGTMVPLKYYQKDKRVQSIMIEVNRKLYLNEEFEKNDNFHQIKELIRTLLKNINERHQLNHF